MSDGRSPGIGPGVSPGIDNASRQPSLWRRANQRLSADLSRLHRDESGAFLILYIAAALLLVALIYAIIGTGQRVVQKELIQSSADAAAFSAAVIKAKGLNVIAFCNLIMALLLAIIMLLRLIKGALMILLGACYAACFASVFTFGATSALCALAPSVQSIYNTYTNILDQVEPRLMDVMRGMAKVERGIAKTFPALSLVEAYRVGTHSHYQKNYSNGVLVSVAFPLPLGEDLSLPVEDGTWNQLCDEAAKSIGRMVEAVIDATGLPGFVGDILGGAVTTLLQPLKGVLCGDGGSASSNTSFTTYEKRYSCSECEGSEKSNWVGDQIARDSDGNPYIVASGVGCAIDGFSSLLCTNPNIVITCGDGKEYTNLTMVECLVKKQGSYDVGTDIQNKPKPLILKSNWKDHRMVRAYSILTDSNMGARRSNVGVASANKGSNPALNQLLSTAQAEIYAHNHHEDLWHMNWRARLVRFTFTNESGGSTSTDGGPPAGTADKILDALTGFLSNTIGAGLANQFLLH